MIKKLFLLPLFFCFFISMVFSQDKLILINGKEKFISSFDTKSPEWIKYKPANSNKIKKIDRFDVFAIQKSDGTEEIVYTPDTANGDPTSEWVRAFIKGQQYGKLHSGQRWCSKDDKWHTKFPYTQTGGLIVGAAGSLLSFYAIPVPAVYALVIGRRSPNLPAATDIEEPMRNNEAFKSGYQKQRRNQRIKQGFVSGMIGLVAGFATFTIIENN